MIDSTITLSAHCILSDQTLYEIQMFLKSHSNICLAEMTGFSSSWISMLKLGKVRRIKRTNLKRLMIGIGRIFELENRTAEPVADIHPETLFDMVPSESFDDELKAMATINGALVPLNNDQRYRILDYINKKYIKP